MMVEYVERWSEARGLDDITAAEFVIEHMVLTQQRRAL
jgi:hypothetical protein